MEQEDGGGNLTVLSALTCEAERRALAGILDDTKWKVLCVDDVQTLRELLSPDRDAVIVMDCLLCDGTEWKEVLVEIETQGLNIQLVVADCHADERLWAEVLNVGAFDLIAKPFKADEVFHVISAAGRALQRNRQCGRAERGATPYKSASVE